MMFPQQLKYALASQSVAVDRPPKQPLSGDINKMIEELKNWAGTDNPGVAVSYFFRQYALFVSAQFDLITHQNAYFACSWDELQFERVHNYGFNLLQIHADSRSYTPFSAAERFTAMHFVLIDQTEFLIQEFRKYVKISPILLWENVLGSLLWFYANLERSNPRRAAEDMEWLLQAANWQPAKASYLLQLLGEVSLSRSVSGPLRKTCCLYKELPGFSTCTYCPNPN